MTDELNAARNKLVDMGFKAHRVSTRLVTGVASRAGAIATEHNRKIMAPLSWAEEASRASANFSSGG